MHEQLRLYRWTPEALTTVTGLQEAVARLRSRVPEQNSRLGLSTILDVARTAVRPQNRIPHLEAIAGLDLALPSRGASASLLRTVADWSHSLAITDWCRTRLPKVILARFPELAQSVHYDKSHLEEALAQSDLSPENSCDLLLRAVEHHVHRFKAEQILALVSIIAARTDETEVATLVDWYAARLAQRLSEGDREGADGEGDSRSAQTRAWRDSSSPTWAIRTCACAGERHTRFDVLHACTKHRPWRLSLRSTGAATNRPSGNRQHAPSIGSRQDCGSRWRGTASQPKHRRSRRSRPVSCLRLPGTSAFRTFCFALSPKTPARSLWQQAAWNFPTKKLCRSGMSI